MRIEAEAQPRDDDVIESRSIARTVTGGGELYKYVTHACAVSLPSPISFHVMALTGSDICKVSLSNSARPLP